MVSLRSQTLCIGILICMAHAIGRSRQIAIQEGISTKKTENQAKWTKLSMDMEKGDLVQNQGHSLKMRKGQKSREQRPPPPEEPPVIIEPLRIEYPFRNRTFAVEPNADTKTNYGSIAPSTPTTIGIHELRSSGNFFDKMHSAQSFKKSSESKSKVRANYELKALFSNIALDKKEPSFAPLLALFKAVELSCVTCGGAHSHQNCPATHGNVYRANISEVRDTPCEVQIPEVNKGPRAPCLFLAHKVQHPSNLSVGGDNEKSRNQANEQIDKFYEIFKEMSFEISFTDALVLMPKFASTLRTLLGNKEKLTEVLRTWMDECLALADLGASINLMPFSVWEKLSLPDLTPTCMTLELADRSISKPMGIAKDILR
ncbi:hypothetical protein Tco_0453628 [Tanacetum coccineum]